MIIHSHRTTARTREIDGESGPALLCWKTDVNPEPNDRAENGLSVTASVLARFLDYSGRRTNWQRRLWNPGTVTVLRETLEAVVEVPRFFGHGGPPVSWS